MEQSSIGHGACGYGCTKFPTATTGKPLPSGTINIINKSISCEMAATLYQWSGLPLDAPGQRPGKWNPPKIIFLFIFSSFLNPAIHANSETAKYIGCSAAHQYCYQRVWKFCLFENFPQIRGMIQYGETNVPSSHQQATD